MLSFFKNPKIILAITLVIVIPFVGYNLFFSQRENRVLSEKTQITIQPSSTSNPPDLTSGKSKPFRVNLQGKPFDSTQGKPTPEVSSTPHPSQKLSKNTYTIAIIGDSMVDTMGEDLSYLKESLRVRYPQTNFNLLNYGIGGQNIKQGQERLNQPFTYQTRSYPPIREINADIIIVASFAYNPFSPHNRDQHWLTLTQLVNELKQTKSDIYLLAEIAPLKAGFGQGPGGINWPVDLASQQAENIRQQLENAVSLSRSLGIPLINAYQKSLVDGKFGDRVYVSSHDGIHPSAEGHLLMADLIASTIKLR